MEYCNKDGFKFISIRRLNTGMPDTYMVIADDSKAARFATKAGVKKRRLRSKMEIERWWQSVVASGVDLNIF
jgi:hypothetical protein